MNAGRYENAEQGEVEITETHGGRRTVRYLRRRRLPDPRDVQPLALHRVSAADRLDLIAARYLGDPLAAWQVADANLALDPDELTAEGTEGDVLVIPFPRAAP
ncbi:LysM domain-containing protein [Pseudactinotalea sp. Z1739]|uniref:LysM domain-containing protein n=1 Tax=Pseudactinotalea sp. Z1739 TaxID=3413028 RepID=UPI003C7EA7D1